MASILSMGFSENAGRRAAYHTQNNAEMAVEWVLQNMDSPDLNDPFEVPSSSSSSSSQEMTFDPEVIMMLSSMGFTEEQVTAALTATDNNPERAGDWLFSHMDDMDAAVASVLSEAAATGDSGDGSDSALDDGEGVYSLHAFISHMGSSATSGHYVCHIKKGGEWVIFNDEKVAKSESTPFGHGYLYIYRRNDTL